MTQAASDKTSERSLACSRLFILLRAASCERAHLLNSSVVAQKRLACICERIFQFKSLELDSIQRGSIVSSVGRPRVGLDLCCSQLLQSVAARVVCSPLHRVPHSRPSPRSRRTATRTRNQYAKRPCTTSREPKMRVSAARAQAQKAPTKISPNSRVIISIFKHRNWQPS